MHSTNPKTSPEKVDVSNIGKLGAEEEGSGLIQAHGKRAGIMIKITVLPTDHNAFVLMPVLRI